MVVLGASNDTVEAQTAFRKKFDLPFPLLADAAGDLGRAFGVLAPGKRSAARATFWIGKDGAVRKTWKSVAPAGHAAEVLDALGAP